MLRALADGLGIGIGRGRAVEYMHLEPRAVMSREQRRGDMADDLRLFRVLDIHRSGY